MSAMASQITTLTIVYSTIYSGVDQRKHQSSASRAFVRGIYRWLVNSPHKGPVTRKMFPFDDVIMVLTSHDSYQERHIRMFVSKWFKLSSLMKNFLFPLGIPYTKWQIGAHSTIWTHVLTRSLGSFSWTYWAPLQTALLNAFSWIDIIIFSLKCHWRLWLRAQLGFRIQDSGFLYFQHNTTQRIH